MANFAFVKVGERHGTVDIPAITEILASEDITASGANQQTAAAPAGTTHVRVGADVAIKICFGADPDATADDVIWMPANSVEYFDINSTNKVAVITA